MTAEQSLSATAAQAWTINVGRAEKIFLNRTDAELRQAIAPGKNRIVYLFGHLIAVHDGMLPLLGIGERRYARYDAVFLEEADDVAAVLPSAAELSAAWREVHAALQAGLEGFTPADWVSRHTAMSDADFAANPLRNRAAVLMNRTAHLAYHLGQCALVAS